MKKSEAHATVSTSSTPAPAQMLLPKSLLDTDQQAAITRLVEYDNTLLIAGMGAGKTVIVQTALAELFDMNALGRVLVVAPKRVAESVWAREATRWEHLRDLAPLVGVATGTPAARARMLADERKRIIVIGVENVPWLVNSGWRAFDGLVCDESTRLKDAGSEAFKALRRAVKRIPWRVCMSGTPVIEGLTGLYAQMVIVDGGEALGRSKQKYLERYFLPTDYNRYDWEPRPGGAEEIARLVAPCVHVVPSYLHTLPALTLRPVPVTLPPRAMSEYLLLAREFCLDDVTASNEAVLSGKLQQVAAGFVYTDKPEPDAPRRTRTIHVEKMLAAADWMDARRAAGEPGIVVYWWEAQQELLRRGGVPLYTDGPDVETDWNAGRIPIMGLHPKSAAHGLNLQHGGARMLWLGPQWSRDLHDQTIARIWRRGQTRSVTVDVLVACGTVDEAIMARLEGKADAQAQFNAHLDAVRGGAS